MFNLPRPRPPAPYRLSRIASFRGAAAALLCLGLSVPAGRAAEPSAAAGSARYGLVSLDVEPSRAEVTLDGEFLDMGVWLISVPPGDHELRVRKDGFREYAGRIAVPAGGKVHLEVRLVPGASRDS